MKIKIAFFIVMSISTCLYSQTSTLNLNDKKSIKNLLCAKSWIIYSSKVGDKGYYVPSDSILDSITFYPNGTFFKARKSDMSNENYPVHGTWSLGKTERSRVDTVPIAILLDMGYTTKIGGINGYDYVLKIANEITKKYFEAPLILMDGTDIPLIDGYRQKISFIPYSASIIQQSKNQIIRPRKKGYLGLTDYDSIYPRINKPDSVVKYRSIEYDANLWGKMQDSLNTLIKTKFRFYNLTEKNGANGFSAVAMVDSSGRLMYFRTTYEDNLPDTTLQRLSNFIRNSNFRFRVVKESGNVKYESAVLHIFGSDMVIKNR